MTRFEKDMIEAMSGNEVEVLKRRRIELENLISEGKRNPNAFRRECIAQEVARLTDEYNKIDSNF